MNAQDALREMYLSGRLRWPSVSVTFSDYERHYEMIANGEVPSDEIRIHAADLYLCCACVHQDPVAFSVFEREAEDTVRGAIARVNRDSEFVRETLQEFWKKLLVGSDARVRAYRAQGPLQAWLRIAAARLALDRNRAAKVVAVRETDLGECLAEQVFGPESTLTRARFHVPFTEALRRAVTGLSQKERNVLRMHLAGRCSIDQIGRAYNVHRATAARWLEQAKSKILQAVRDELALVGPPLTDSEFQSVARVVGGELELGMSMLQSEVPLQRSPSTR
jgi:RNA polymerase sigma-70 factor (ECF subfamily)